MKLIVLLSLIVFTQPGFTGDIPQSWLKVQKTQPKAQSNTKSITKIENSTLSESANTKMRSILDVHRRIINRTRNKDINLERLDVGLGISSSGDIGIFSTGKSSSVELIWKKNKSHSVKSDNNNNNQDEEITLNFNQLTTTKEIEKELLDSIQSVVNYKGIKRRVRRKITRTLAKDAVKIRKFIQTIVTIPQIGHWYISGFWRKYYFSTSFGISNFNIGYDKRLRFRFKISRAPMRKIQKAALRKNILTGLMSTFNNIQLREDTSSGFRFDRVRASFDVEAGFDVLVFSKSIGKGFLVEFKRKKSFIDYDTKPSRFSHRVISKVTNSLTHFISKRDNSEIDFPLSQIRYGFGLSSGFDFVLASLENETSIDLHFSKIKEKANPLNNVNEVASVEVPTLTGEVRKVNPLVRMKQIDYRHRLNLSYKIPFIGRARVRPSIEYRYKTRSIK